MKVNIEVIDKTQEEQALLQCHEISKDITEIADFIKSKDATLLGYENERIYQVALDDIYYVEAVDNRVFACLEKHVYELKCKLYEFETLYNDRRFFRCSKSVIVNLMKINCIKPALNGRFIAKLVNGEEIIISRQYVPSLKKILVGGQV